MSQPRSRQASMLQCPKCLVNEFLIVGGGGRCLSCNYLGHRATKVDSTKDDHFARRLITLPVPSTPPVVQTFICTSQCAGESSPCVNCKACPAAA